MIAPIPHLPELPNTQRPATDHELHFASVLAEHYSARSAALPDNRWIKQSLLHYKSILNTKTIHSYEL